MCITAIIPEIVSSIAVPTYLPCTYWFWILAYQGASCKHQNYSRSGEATMMPLANQVTLIGPWNDPGPWACLVEGSLNSPNQYWWGMSPYLQSCPRMQSEALAKTLVTALHAVYPGSAEQTSTSKGPQHRSYLFMQHRRHPARWVMILVTVNITVQSSCQTLHSCTALSHIRIYSLDQHKITSVQLCIQN